MNETAKKLSSIKSEIAFYECCGYEDLILFTSNIARQIVQIYQEYIVNDHFFKRYIDEVVLKNVIIAEEFVGNLKEMEGKTEFKARSIKYHLNFIIASFMYALVYQENKKNKK